MIEEQELKEKVSKGEYIYSRHADNERQEDNLLVEEVEDALFNGRILEHYADTGRGESCLVAGFTRAGKPIHIVFARNNGISIIVTVYLPKPPKFKTPFIRGD